MPWKTVACKVREIFPFLYWLMTVLMPNQDDNPAAIYERVAYIQK